MLYGKSFDEFNRVTEKNKPYLFIGRRQVREGGGISMFVDACYPLTNDEARINSIMRDRAYLTAVKESGRKKIRSEQIQPSSEPVEVLSDMPEEIVTDEAHASDEGKRNVLRIVFEGSPDSAGFNRLLNFLAYFHGNMTVEVEFASDGSVTMLDNVCAIDPDESVIRKLCDIVGEDNVRFL
jgi:DNA polymerase-3 subunit alpha